MLTTKQREVIETFWKVGRFRAEEIVMIYSSHEARVECLGRLSSLGIIEGDPETNNFIINRERFLELEC